MTAWRHLLGLSRLFAVTLFPDSTARTERSLATPAPSPRHEASRIAGYPWLCGQAMVILSRRGAVL